MKELERVEMIRGVRPESKLESFIRGMARVLRSLGQRVSRIEMELLRRKNFSEFERRMEDRDPPCVKLACTCTPRAVCGRWSEDWLCPNCRQLYPWMHPERGIDYERDIFRYQP